MKKLLLIIFNLLVIPPVAMYSYYTFSPAKQALDNPPTVNAPASPKVLGATDNPEQIYFTVNIPATFKRDISAPNIVYSVNGETGEIDIDNSLIAGSGIEVKGRTISNTGILTLVAGDGVSIDGNKITNSGILSLEAGTNINIDGNTITNTYTAQTIDYGQSGWTDNGSTIVLTTTTDTVTVGGLTFDSATITNGNSFLPDTDLGSDLGSTAKRFNNLWVANINSNSSQSFSGQTTFSYAPQDTTLSEASVLINPTTSAASGQLLGLAIAGYQKALIDEDGDITLGYSDATSAPASDYPLNIYGHSGTRVSFVDTSGNASFNGSLTAASGIFGPNAVSATFYRDGGTYGGIQVRHLTNYETKFYGNNNYETLLEMFDRDNDPYVSIPKLGIGTTNPTSTLQIGDSTSNNIQLFGNSSPVRMDLGWNGNSRLFFTGNAEDSFGASYTGLRGAIRIGGSAGGYAYISQVGSDGNLLLNPVSGNVGIGTTAPGAKLEVAGLVFQTGLGNSTFFGENAGLSDDLSDNRNVFVGYNAGYANTTGQYNVASGYQALSTNTTGSYNIATGYRALRLNVGTGNTANGYETLINNIGNYNTATGYHSLTDITGGTRNTAIGYNTGRGITTGDYNTIIGADVSGLAIDLQQNIIIADGLGNQRIRILDNGNVGIGTTNPDKKLHIYSTETGGTELTIENSGANAYLAANINLISPSTARGAGIVTQLGSSGPKWFFGNPYSIGDNFVINRYNSNHVANASLNNLFLIDNTGNVGIGTTSPGTKLSVNGSTVINGVSPLYTNNALSVYQGNTPVGIIVNNSSSLTTLTGSYDEPELMIQNSDTTTNNWTKFYFGSSRTNTASVQGAIGVQNILHGASGVSGKGDMAFFTRNTTTFSEKMRITNDGNIGIGTTSPITKLDVNGNIAINGINAHLSSLSFVVSGATRAKINGAYLETNYLRSLSGAASPLVIRGNSAQTANIFEIQESGGAILSGVDERGILFSNGGIDANSVYIGNDAGRVGATGTQNTGLGWRVLQDVTTGSQNTAFGASAGLNITTGSTNTAIGGSALIMNTDGISNTAVGSGALYYNNGGDYNTAVGTSAISANITGVRNVAIGMIAGRDTADGSGLNKTGSYNIYIGSHVKALADGGQNEIIIGYGATGLGSNSVLLGTNDTTLTALKGNVGIGTTAPAELLDVAGNITTSSLTTGTVYSNAGVLTNTDPSDETLKDNILTLEDGTLDKVLGLRPVSFDWKSTGDGALSFIAQEVNEIFPELVGSNSDGTLGLYTTQFIPILAKAIQEQQLVIDEIALSSEATITNEDWNIMDSLVHQLETLIADIQSTINGYKDKFITKKSIQEELCIGTEDEMTCITKDQLDDLLIPTLPSESPTPEPTPTESPEATSSATP